MIGLGSDKKDKTFTFVRVGLRGRRTLVVMSFVIGKNIQNHSLTSRIYFLLRMGFLICPKTIDLSNLYVAYLVVSSQRVKSVRHC